MVSVKTKIGSFLKCFGLPPLGRLQQRYFSRFDFLKLYLCSSVQKHQITVATVRIIVTVSTVITMLTLDFYHHVISSLSVVCLHPLNCRHSVHFSLVPVVTTMSVVIAVSTFVDLLLYSHTYQLQKLETHTTCNISRQSWSFGVFYWYLQKKSSCSQVANTCVQARLSETY